HKITDFYADAFNIPNNDVNLKVYHTPQFNEDDLKGLQVTLESQSHNISPGYQTLKLKTWQDNQLKKSYRVTMKVIIKYPVLIASEKISYKNQINSDNTKIKNIKITSRIDKYMQKSDLNGELISTQLIRKGEIIHPSMVKQKPDVNRGEEVNVHLISGSILIKTKGRIHRDCRVGESVQVTLNKTRERLKGEIQSPNLILVNLQ
ncbi:MAG: flagellar basal body P-ring formation chaperone FlgA, partial [Candidatus Marinimicrobia bacterium]|nr:flagellar basal body P-ring formation chaperone FlgA [Candidatus Neomarinimicrobiota bacterium]